jgi:hypothetical protein
MADFCDEDDEGPMVVTQAIFDAMVKQEEEEGATLEEAAAAVCDDMGGDDMTGVFKYSNTKEQEECAKSLNACQTLLKCADGTDTYVNASFALQGLFQGIQTDVPCAIHRLALLKGQKIVNTLIRFMALPVEGDAEPSGGCGGGDDSDSDSDSDSDDEDAERLSKGAHALEFLRALLVAMHEQTPALVTSAFSLASEEVALLLAYLDEYNDDYRIASSFVALVPLLAAVGDNGVSFKAAEVDEKVVLTLKLHKKKSGEGSALARDAQALAAVIAAL